MFDSVFEYCSWLENDHASVINDFVNLNQYRILCKADVDNFLNENHIDYKSLPQYLKDKLDEIELY